VRRLLRIYVTIFTYLALATAVSAHTYGSDSSRYVLYERVEQNEPDEQTEGRAGAVPRPTPVPPASVRVPILMYHYVSSPAANADRLRRELSVEPAVFEAQMRWLKDAGYHTVTLDDVHAHLKFGSPLPDKPIVLTFDDGHIDHYSFVFPLLRSLEMTGTFFVVADFATYSYTNPDYLSWKQAREMADGGMRIESHARTHHDLRNRSFKYLVWEVLGSIEQIEAYTGRRPRFFCYPAGQFDDAVVRMLKSVEMDGAVTTVHGAQQKLANAYTWPRIRIRYGTTIGEFAAQVAGGAVAAAYPTPMAPPDPLYSPLATPTPTPTPTSEPPDVEGGVPVEKPG
jgi:peptidoglycan/xylan/chitin deacetylase (PgdA/CDA1 family)